MDFIYHITKSSWWATFSPTDPYESETFSEERFIHCSRREQVDGVLERYYSNQTGLLLLHINTASLKAELKYEKTASGQSFPHVYGSIERDAIVKVEEISKK